MRTHKHLHVYKVINSPEKIYVNYFIVNLLFIIVYISLPFFINMLNTSQYFTILVIIFNFGNKSLTLIFDWFLDPLKQ